MCSLLFAQLLTPTALYPEAQGRAAHPGTVANSIFYAEGGWIMSRLENELRPLVPQSYQ